MSFFGRGSSSSSSASTSSASASGSSGSSPTTSGLSLSNDMNTQKVEVMNQVRQELGAATLQDFVNKMTEKCYKTCVPSGRTELSHKDQTCLANCAERFQETFDIVARTYIARLNTEKQRAAGTVSSGESLL